jgi:DNA-binding NarL/FixJ family response regulator
MTSILIVEDHPAFAQAVAHLLQSRYDAETAHTAEEALERLQDSGADLVLIDISLPGRNGLWLLNALQNIKPGLPCLVLSGYANELYVEQSLEAGARGYILKEDLPGLLEGIQAVLNGGTYVSAALRSD